jgi:hypothetical protein
MEFVSRKYVYEPVYWQFTPEEREEVNTLCARLQEIFCGDGYSVDMGCTLADTTDVTITIRGAIVPNNYKFLD